MIDPQTPPAMTIRPFAEVDEASVIALWGRCGLLRPWNDPRRDIARKLRVQPDLFLVGTLDGQVVASAMAGYDGHRGWIYYLAVDPGCQRAGLGRAIMAAAEERLRALGCPKINLQVRRGNAEAVAFYQRIGFEEDAVLGFGKRLEADLPDASEESV